MAENDWISEMAAKRKARREAEAAIQESRDKEDREFETIHARDLPDLKAQLGHAAERVTDDVKQKCGYGSEMTCLFDPAGTIEMHWSQTPGAKLVIGIPNDVLSLHLEMTHGADKTNVAFPSATLRVNDGQLQIQLDGQPVTPDEAASRLLRPFFEYIADED